MRYKVLLHIDELQRDYASTHWIGFFLERLGADVCYSTRRTRKLLWEHWKPHAVLDSHINYHACEEALKSLTQNTLLFLLPAEGLQFCEEHIHIPYTGPENDKSHYLKHLEKIFLWGEWQYSLLEKRNLVPKGLVTVSGNPKYDAVEWLQNKNKKKNSVGIVGLFNGINIFDDRNFLSFIYSLRKRHNINFDKNREVEDFIWYQVATFRIFMELVQELISNGHTVSVRPHQLENHNNYAPFKKIFGARFQVNKGGSFHDWLLCQHAVVVMKTTSLYESFLAGVPIITVEDMVNRLDEHMTIPNYRVPELKHCWRPKSTEEACLLVDRAVKGEISPCVNPTALRQKIKEYFDFPREKPSSFQIASEIYNSCVQRFGNSIDSKGASPRWLGKIPFFLDRQYFQYEKKYNLKKESRDIWEQCIAKEFGKEEK